MKQCSFCFKEIEDGVKNCPDCGSTFGSEGSTPARKTKWYFRGTSLFISFLVAGPFMLPLVWLHPTYSRVKKAVLSLIIIGLTLLLTVGTVAILKPLLARYQQIYQELQPAQPK